MQLTLNSNCSCLSSVVSTCGPPTSSAQPYPASSLKSPRDFQTPRVPQQGTPPRIQESPGDTQGTPTHKHEPNSWKIKKKHGMTSYCGCMRSLMVTVSLDMKIMNIYLLLSYYCPLKNDKKIYFKINLFILK